MDMLEFVVGCENCDPRDDPERAAELLRYAAELGTAILKNRAKNSVSDDDNGFSRFWQAYPKKVAKQSAMKAWKKLKPNGELTGIILEALERHKCSAQWKADKGQYIPYPATWLNGRRWEDDLEQTVQSDFDPNDPYKDWR